MRIEISGFCQEAMQETVDMLIAVNFRAEFLGKTHDSRGYKINPLQDKSCVERMRFHEGDQLITHLQGGNTVLRSWHIAPNGGCHDVTAALQKGQAECLAAPRGPQIVMNSLIGQANGRMVLTCEQADGQGHVDGQSVKRAPLSSRLTM